VWTVPKTTLPPTPTNPPPTEAHLGDCPIKPTAPRKHPSACGLSQDYAAPTPTEPLPAVTIEPTRRPRIIFLADRNILASQAVSDFDVFPPPTPTTANESPPPTAPETRKERAARARPAVAKTSIPNSGPSWNSS